MIDIHRQLVRTCWFVAGLMILFSGLACAGEGFPAVLIDRDAALAVAHNVTAERYPDADTVLVDAHTWVRYNEDGTYVQRDERYQKVLTQEGVASLKSLSSWFTVPYNTTRFVLVEVIRPDGSVIPIDVAANARVMIDRSQMDANIYNPNDKILSVNLPELGIGDVVHYSMDDDFSKVRIPGSFSDMVPFEGPYPIVHTAYTLVAPVALPLRKTALRDPVGNTVAHTERRTGKSIIYTWEGTHIPQVFPEPDMPSFHTVSQRSLVSTIPDWEWISRWYWNLSKPHLEQVTPAMKTTVEELMKGMDTPQKQIRAIFTWVSQEVRYLGLTLEKNAPGYEPHPVDMTFERRAGVCRDKAALLVAMLRLGGFDAYPVLIMSGPKKDPEVPLPFFNHAISAVRMADGTYLLMDPTDEHSRELFPPYLNNCSYLVATPTGETLHTSPSIPARENLLKITTSARLTTGGRLDAQSQLRFLGINDSAYRGFFVRAPQEKQRAYFEGALKEAFPGAVLQKIKVLPENSMDTSVPLEVHLDFQVPHPLAGTDPVVMLPVPPMGENIGIARMLIDKMGLETRRYPLFSQYACGVEETFVLDLGQGVGQLVSSPAPVVWHSREMSFEQSFEIKDNQLTARRLFTLNLPEYSPKEYVNLKHALVKREQQQRGECIFAARAQVQDDASWYASFTADAVILSRDVTYEVQDDHTWVAREHVRKKILTYAGKKENSEISIDYTPVWENVRIVNASVTALDGAVRTIEPQEINRMDAPWVGKAPRYPAAKTLVANLPGVEQGSVLEYTIERSLKDQPFFSMLETMASEYPVVREDVLIRVPRDLAVRVLKSDQGWGLEKMWVRKSEKVITADRTVKDGRVEYAFSARRVRPVVQEKNLPPGYTYLPSVAMTSGTWKGYAQMMSGHFFTAAAAGEMTAKEARRLVSGVSGDLEKIRVIRDFVAKNITQTGPDLNDGPWNNLSTADTTLEDGYGNSADTAILLYAMLRAVGFEPRFVVAGDAPAVVELQGLMRSFVSPGWLGDVLVRVKVGDQELYLNDTDEYARLGTTPHHALPGLVLPAGEVEIIRAAKEMTDRDGFAYDITLQENGDARISLIHTLWGAAYSSRHKMLAEMSPEAARRYQLEQASGISLNAQLITYSKDFEAYPGRETLTVFAKKFGTRQGEFLYLDLPGMIKGLAGVDGESRVNPLYRDEGTYASIRVRVHLPATVKDIVIPPAATLRVPVAKGGFVAVKTMCLPSASGLLADIPCRTVDVQIQADVDPMVVPPNAYALVREAEDILARQAQGTLMLRLKTD
ncbi:MAG: DUF3857 domain-containing protein [Desulfoplanes sp.]